MGLWSPRLGPRSAPRRRPERSVRQAMMELTNQRGRTCGTTCLLTTATNDTSTELSICRTQKGHDVSCQNRNLTEVPDLSLPAIRKLDLSHNSIGALTEESLLTLGSLRHLDVSNNQLKTITSGALGHLSKLRELNLSNNLLTRNFSSGSGAFSLLYKLKVLHLSDNYWDSDTVAQQLKNLSSLEELHLSGNLLMKLTADTLCGMQSLKHVALERNYITEISAGTFECLAHLDELNLAMNSLSCISDFHLSKLKVLNISRNGIEFFMTNVSDDEYQLRELDLSHNRLFHFPLLPKLHHIERLNLSGNFLISVAAEPLKNASEWEIRNRYDEMKAVNKIHNDNAHSTLSEVIFLDLSNNALIDISHDFLNKFSSLRHLNLSGNCFQNFSIEDEDEFNLLLSLDLSDNELSNISLAVDNLKFLQSLKFLYLQNNSIQLLPSRLFELLPRIERVNLANNNVRLCNMGNTTRGIRKIGTSCVSFSGIPTLKHLKLDGNNITHLGPLSFYHTPLTYLDLSRNQYLDVPGQALKGLEHSLKFLSLRWNLIQTSKVTLTCLNHLRDLDLSYNQLDMLPLDVGCAPLKSLDIRGNNLQFLQDKVIKNVSQTLETLYLSGNVFNCCALTWLELLNGTQVEIPDVANARCFYPSGNNSSTVTLLHDYMGECANESITKPNPLLLIISALATLLVIGSVIILVVRECCRLCLPTEVESSEADTAPVKLNNEHPKEGISLSVIKIDTK
ncbi:transforming growth factor beta activator LRRC32-like [Leucoraja erinacea]|uniref:transforming growth factor beta activator LRRC32-like n=1 Tax=Leucoraja erinaceus TaxID=7782 RepID=UPI0024579FE8|nr:transforming growth factor beta activator LRRC32-like [Leucoraja erinacea]